MELKNNRPAATRRHPHDAENRQRMSEQASDARIPLFRYLDLQFSAQFQHRKEQQHSREFLEGRQQTGKSDTAS